MTAIVGIASATAKGLNRVLRGAGVQLARTGPRPFVEFQDFIPFATTVARAAEAGMSVGDYIDQQHNRPGITGETIDRLTQAGILSPSVRRIGEIGPGSGRYLERTMKACRPDHYEIYETATEWRDYLSRTHKVIARQADGKTLSATPSGSLNLVQAHKVFPGLPSLGTLRYLREMVRVLAPGGRAVFDTVTEPCLDDQTVDRFLGSEAAYQCYPAMMPRQYLIDFFERRGFSFRLSFEVPMEPGKTECFAFVAP